MINLLEDIMYKMKDIKYGYLYNGENIYPYDKWDNNFYKKYLLQINNELEKTKYGVCWDFVELERYYLKQTNLNFKSYFIFSNDGMEFPNHTFIIVNLNDKFIWIEKSWEKYQGLYFGESDWRNGNCYSGGYLVQ